MERTADPSLRTVADFESFFLALTMHKLLETEMGEKKLFLRDSLNLTLLSIGSSGIFG